MEVMQKIQDSETIMKSIEKTSSFSDFKRKNDNSTSENNASVKRKANSSFKVISSSSLKWRTIKHDNLDLSYTKAFSMNDADLILQRLESEVEYFTGDLLKVKVFGKWHSIPRKQVSYGDTGLTYRFSGNSIPALPWTDLMLEIKTSVEKLVDEKFNFVLVNRYKDGDDYMGEHKDDEKDMVASSPIASLSFGQPRDFTFRHKDSRGSKATQKIDSVKLVLEHGSLLIMNHPTNQFWYHCLPKRKNVPHVRVNLTFRKMKT